MSDNEIYLLIKYIKSVLWRVAKCLSYIQEARCLEVNLITNFIKLPDFYEKYLSKRKPHIHVVFTTFPSLRNKDSRL
jgi:hypothetical protein